MRGKIIVPFLLLQILSTVHSYEVLPGLDVLSAGFDAASWSSKSRIFDLEKAEQSQKVYVHSIDKTYVAPDFVTVVTHGAQSKRVEESCVGVYTHFSEYVHTYQSSVGFDVGIHTGSFSLGIAANKDVQKVYESITKEGQAVGSSESWWGVFEATLPPPFLMGDKMSPMFQQTVKYLNKMGAPKTEAEQSIYNQVLESFGTHYVTSVITGGRAKMTNFVNSSYHKEHSETTVSSQVSIGFEWKKFSLSLSDKAKDFEKKLTEDFRNNSNQVLTFQPDLKEIHEAKAPWLKWEQAVAQEPTVVNTSASSIANLFFQNADVLNHMQETIDFYTQHQHMPKLADIKPKINLMNPILPLYANKGNDIKKTTPAPGLKIVGCGFDATTLSSKTCLFEQASPDLPSSQWQNPYYPDIVYDVPFGYFAANTPESLLVDATVIMQSINDYVEKSVYYESHHHSGFLGFGSKTETKTTKKYYQNFYAHNYKLALSLRQIAWYTLRMSEFPLPKFSKTFQQSLDFLPNVFNTSDTQGMSIFKMFFDAFGTDVVTSADMGGMVWAENWFESCLSKMYSDICITHTVNRGWWFVHHHDITKKCDKRIINDLKKYSEAHYEMLGGTSGKIKQKDWDKWVYSVKYDPRPVKYSLAPIHYLLPDSHPKRRSLEEATLHFLKTSHEEQQKVIEELKKLRPPPASICKKIHPPTQNELLQDKEKSILEADPSDVLCPFVGYHGAYCPKKYSKKNLKFNQQNDLNSIKGQIPLPRGVGLTIDVTTGELKLPALNYVDSKSSIWTDPKTGDVFNIPIGVSLTVNGTESENKPIIRVFKTEQELASVWESGYKAGTWLGGEFGQSKGILDLYTKFFSKQQATSINQHPQSLYKLSLTGEWEKKLNDFVKYALKALPEKYDANIYDRFMDTWGTHVAIDTLVGGMSEQQVIMKDCMWKSSYLTGGITDPQLLQFLEMELGMKTPPSGYYKERRQMHIDHRIGGNPEVKEKTTWINTLAKNPALVKIYAQVEWSIVAEKAGIVSRQVVVNLKTAVQNRMTLSENQRVKEAAETAKKRLEYLQGPRSVVAMVGHGRRGTIAPQLETGKYLTLKGLKDCPPDLNIAQSKLTCNTGLYITSWNHYRLTEPLRYERNEKGEMRSVRCFDLDSRRQCITHYGPWVRNGCSLQPYATGQERPFHTPVPSRTVVAMVCADCQIVTAGFPQDSTLKCVCPGY